MSHEATNWAFKQRGLKPAAKIVLLALADRHNPDMGCFPSKKTIAEDCELSERSVYDQIKLLEEMGLVFIEPEQKVIRGQYASNRYILGFELDFPSQNLPSAKSAVGRIQQEPSANSAVGRRQNLPTNPVNEPCKRTSKKTNSADDERKPPKRASALPENWLPSDRNLNDAKSRNFTDEEVHEQAAAFRDHHLARGTTFKDWDAAWRTWLGNARRFARPAAARNARPRSAHDVMLAGFQSAALRDGS